MILVAIDTAFSPLIGHTYECDDGHSTSWPDHFLANSKFASKFKLIKSLKYGANLSDHHPHCADIKVNWGKVSPEQVSYFNDLVANSLPCLSPNVISCTDPACTAHLPGIDFFLISLQQCLVHDSRSSFSLLL